MSLSAQLVHDMIVRRRASKTRKDATTARQETAAFRALLKCVTESPIGIISSGSEDNKQKPVAMFMNSLLELGIQGELITDVDYLVSVAEIARRQQLDRNVTEELHHLFPTISRVVPELLRALPLSSYEYFEGSPKQKEYQSIISALFRFFTFLPSFHDMFTFFDIVLRERRHAFEQNIQSFLSTLIEGFRQVGHGFEYVFESLKKDYYDRETMISS